MQYAIELYYDKETEQKLFNLAKRVADEKLSTKFLEWKTRPHLTLACFNDVNETKCIQQLNNFAKHISQCLHILALLECLMIQGRFCVACNE